MLNSNGQGRPFISGCCGWDTAHHPPRNLSSCCESLWYPVSSLLTSSLIALALLVVPCRGRRGAGGAIAPLPPASPLTPCYSSSDCLFDCVCTLHCGLVFVVALVLAPRFTYVLARGSVHLTYVISFSKSSCLIYCSISYLYYSFFLRLFRRLGVIWHPPLTFRTIPPL